MLLYVHGNRETVIVLSGFSISGITGLILLVGVWENVIRAGSSIQNLSNTVVNHLAHSLQMPIGVLREALAVLRANEDFLPTH